MAGKRTARALDTERPLMRPAEAAVFLGTTVDTLKHWRLVRKGPPYVKIESSVRYVPADLDAYIANNMGATDGW